MKINKQLFENVLAGKLKGAFVLKNGFTVKSNRLFDSNSTNCYRYCFKGFSTSFTVLGKSSSAGYDIIDFISDTKENELTIEIPDNKVVDWDESKKQNKIILKDKQLTYEDVCKKLFKKKGYYFIYGPGRIGQGEHFDENTVVVSPNHASTMHQLECILAKNKLANIALFLNDGWKPLFDSDIFLLRQTSTGVSVFEAINGSCASDCGSIWFKTKELAQQAIEILGEKTVKLALEPLGI